jgi:hypothetical protein
MGRNYPIGTGITEAAAKTIVGTRMKRAGARFSHPETVRDRQPKRNDARMDEVKKKRPGVHGGGRR